MRLLFASSAFALLFTSAYVIVKIMRIGPTVAVISKELGWGIHSGDFLALVPLAAALVLLHRLLKSV